MNPTCRLCQAPFLLDEFLFLHMGRRHDGLLTEDERARFADAVAAESRWSQEVRKHARGTLYTVPFVLFFAFFVILSAIYNVAYWAVLPAPGVVIFGLLAYYMGYTRDDAPDRTGRAV
jgi:hypothetical protein